LCRIVRTFPGELSLNLLKLLPGLDFPRIPRFWELWSLRGATLSFPDGVGSSLKFFRFLPPLGAWVFPPKRGGGVPPFLPPGPFLGGAHFPLFGVLKGPKRRCIPLPYMPPGKALSCFFFFVLLFQRCVGRVSGHRW